MKKYLRKNRRYLLAALFSILISTVFATALQFFKGNVLDHAVAGEIHKTIQYALLLIAFILLEVLCYFCYRQFSAAFIVGCTKKLKADIFESILYRSYVAYKKRPQGEYLAKYTNEANTIKERHFNMLPMFFEILFKIVFVSAALFLLDWRIALVTIALLTTPLYIPKIIEKKLQNAQSAYIQAVNENIAKVNDWFYGFEIIKNFSIERRIMVRFHAANDVSMEKLLRNTQLDAVAQLITTLISYLSYFIVLICAAWLVLTGDFSAGDFFVAIGIIDQLSYPLISLAGIIQNMIAIKPVCSEMESFLKASEISQMKTELNSGLKNIESCIEFKNVSFAHEAHRKILDGFNLTIHKGKRYLLKGPSGCGKTTTVNLLLRYYDVAEGCIEIDGIPIEKLESTYDFITVVRQEAILFHDTLRNNLTMYRDIAEYRLIEVLKSVGLDRFANAHALDSVVEQSGSNFSGGEKKRICLARALLRDTDLLIFDEPLANLDIGTAELIEDLLLSIQNRTILIVSHQFTEMKLDRFDKVINFALDG